MRRTRRSCQGALGVAILALSMLLLPGTAEAEVYEYTVTQQLNDELGCVWQNHLVQNPNTSEYGRAEENTGPNGNTCNSAYAALYSWPDGPYPGSLTLTDAFQQTGGIANATKSGHNRAWAMFGCLYNQHTSNWSCYLSYTAIASHHDRWVVV